MPFQYPIAVRVEENGLALGVGSGSPWNKVKRLLRVPDQIQGWELLLIKQPELHNGIIVLSETDATAREVVAQRGFATLAVDTTLILVLGRPLRWPGEGACFLLERHESGDLFGTFECSVTWTSVETVASERAHCNAVERLDLDTSRLIIDCRKSPALLPRLTTSAVHWLIRSLAIGSWPKLQRRHDALYRSMLKSHKLTLTVFTLLVLMLPSIGACVIFRFAHYPVFVGYLLAAVAAGVFLRIASHLPERCALVYHRLYFNALARVKRGQ